MPGRIKKGKEYTNLRSITQGGFPTQDSRNDLGYGRTKDKFHKPRSKPAAYPYKMTDEEQDFTDDLEDIEIDDVPEEFESRTLRKVDVVDFYCAAGSDPFYYVGGATRLGETVGKAVRSHGGIGVTLPAGIGSSTSGFRSIIRPTGGREGWSAAPKSSYEDLVPGEELEDFLFLDDEFDEMGTMRAFVRRVLQTRKKNRT